MIGQTEVRLRGHSRPQLVVGLEGRFVVDIATGAEHTLVLTSSGEVWGWGTNVDGQLGMGHTATIREPQPLPALQCKNVRQVSTLL